MLRTLLPSLLAAARRSSRLQAVRAMTTANELDNTSFLKSVSKEQAKRALERHTAIYANHIAATRAGDSQVDSDEANRKRIIYRSKQRGWLEVDLLLGRWASENVMHLSHDELRQYEDILNEETIDIFNYISKKSPVPKRVDTPMMKRLQAFCLTSPLGKASIEGFAENKKFMSN